jgi:hypothetical protein
MARDRIIQGGCSKRRPDGLIDCETHTVIIEIDEDQHRSYEEQCENKRIMEIFRDLGSRPLIVIRLNPDGYTCDGERFGGAFTRTKVDNHLKVNDAIFVHRLERLLKEVASAITHVPIREISIVELFFPS